MRGGKDKMHSVNSKKLCGINKIAMETIFVREGKIY
jgi:hypothetical protein